MFEKFRQGGDTLTGKPARMLRSAWTDAWARHGTLAAGHDLYRHLLQSLDSALNAFAALPRLRGSARPGAAQGDVGVQVRQRRGGRSCDRRR